MDHPRLCGEKSFQNAGETSHRGSPPPMRGKVTHRAEHHTAKRITPAYAGKRKCSAASQSGFTDHPRLCGEKISPFNMISITIGSPPPMRGKVWHFAGNCSNDGITPAYAGKSSISKREPYSFRDHPRLCGEKL